MFVKTINGAWLVKIEDILSVTIKKFKNKGVKDFVKLEDHGLFLVLVEDGLEI